MIFKCLSPGTRREHYFTESKLVCVCIYIYIYMYIHTYIYLAEELCCGHFSITKLHSSEQ
jgi:hypothetical protein